MFKKYLLIIMIPLLFLGCSETAALFWGLGAVGTAISQSLAAKTTVVLLDNNQSHNAIIVSTDKGSSKLDQVGSYADLKDKDQAPSETKTMSEEEIYRRFAKALTITPEHAATYILYFEVGSTQLTEASEKVLEEAITAIQNNAPCMVDVIGHTDTVGSNEFNAAFSVKRAQFVADMIQEKRLEITSLKVKGFGEEDLLVKTPDNTSEAKNRNVEIFIK